MGARCDDGRRGIIFFGARRRWQKLIFHNTSGDCSCSCVSQSKEKNCMLRVTFLLAGNNERRAVAFICFMARRLSHLASTIKSKQEINYLLHAECRRRAAVAHDRHPAKTFYDRRNLSCWQFLLLLSARRERCSLVANCRRIKFLALPLLTLYCILHPLRNGRKK